MPWDRADDSGQVSDQAGDDGNMDSVAVMLGKRMRRMRERKGLNQTDLARLVLSSKSAISDYENGNRAPDADMIARLDTALEADGVLTEEHGLLGLGEQDSATIADVEHDAIGLVSWSTWYVPGLLQTEGYARASMSTVIPADKLEREVAIRLARQKVLNELVSGWFVIAEAVLHHDYGDRETMRDQLLRLEQVAAMPNIGLQVMPFRMTRHSGGEGPLYVVEYADRPALWFTESRSAGRISTDRTGVLRAQHALSQIRATALSPVDSVELIRTTREANYEQ
jgi:transcriptional regulator with XRE-family HTH domain